MDLLSLRHSFHSIIKQNQHDVIAEGIGKEQIVILHDTIQTCKEIVVVTFNVSYEAFKGLSNATTDVDFENAWILLEMGTKT